MSDIILALATFLTGLLGPAAGPLSGGLPVVVLLALIALGLGTLPAAARADAAEHSEAGGRRG